MSSDTEQGEERRLPATWEEFQEERRKVASKAFHAGARWAAPHVKACGPRTVIAAADYVRDAYPITRRVPRVADLSEKVTARVVDGRIAFQAFDGGHHYAAPIRFLTPEDVKAVADLLANPFEEVSE